MNIEEYGKFRRKVNPKRYGAIFDIIMEGKKKHLMELGTYKGKRAKQMIEVAKIHNIVCNIEYWGFDLFELMTDEIYKKEMSKRPPNREWVFNKLSETGANIFLYRGDTKVVLPKIVDNLKYSDIDFIFIDGGHSVETIESDWSYVKEIMGENTTVIFDDYYENKTDFGCNGIINKLDTSEYNINLLDPMEVYPQKWGDLYIRMVKVEKK